MPICIGINEIIVNCSRGEKKNNILNMFFWCPEFSGNLFNNRNRTSTNLFFWNKKKTIKLCWWLKRGREKFVQRTTLKIYNAWAVPQQHIYLNDAKLNKLSQQKEWVIFVWLFSQANHNTWNKTQIKYVWKFLLCLCICK